jgi:hypothetical protein
VGGAERYEGTNIGLNNPEKHSHDWIPKSLHEMQKLSDNVCYAVVAAFTIVFVVLGIVFILVVF